MDVPRLIEAVGSIVWPLLAGLALWFMYPVIRDIAKSRGFTIKIGDMELTVQEASEQLRAQLEDLQKKVSELRSGPQTSQQLVAAAAAAPTQPPTTPHLLWVDDNPANNAFEIARLRDAGVAVSEATTTEEALRFLSSGSPVHAVVTDMGRKEGGSFRPRAGLDLIRQARAGGVSVPFFVYSSQRSAARSREDVTAAGGNGSTSSTVELFEHLRDALGVAA